LKGINHDPRLSQYHRGRRTHKSGTLVVEEKARNFMYALRPEWMNCVVSYVGKSSGLLVTWDPKLFDLVPFLSYGGIFLSASSLADKRKIYLLNF
jgi:hypothetical protein